MKNKNNQNDLRILVPFFCYCCAKGSKYAIEKGDKKFIESQMKIELSSDFIKTCFKNVRTEIQNPLNFWNSINHVFQSIDNQYEESIAKMVINSIKRLISITAKDLNLNEKKCSITTSIIVENQNDFNLLIENIYQSIEESTCIVFAMTPRNKIMCFTMISELENHFKVLTDIMISQIEDYWNTTSFRK